MFFKRNIYLLKLLLVVFLALHAGLVSAQNKLDELSTSAYPTTLDKIERDMTSARDDEQKLVEMIKLITNVKSGSIECVNTESEKLGKFKSDLATLGQSVKIEAKRVKDKREELNSEILGSEKRLASCSVFVLRSEELLKQLNISHQDLLAERFFAKGPNINELIQESWNKPALWFKSVSSFLLNNTGIELLSLKDMMVLFVVFIIAFFSGRAFRQKIIEYINKKMMNDTFSNHFSRSLLAVSAFYSPYLLVSCSLAIYCYVLTSKIVPVPFISVIAYGLPIYFSLIAIVEIFLDPRQPAIPFHNLPELVSKGLAQRLKVFFLLLFIGYLLFTTLLTQSLPKETLLLSRGILVFVFVLNLVWAVRILGQLPRFADTYLMRFGLSLILLSVLILELSGYRNLSTYLITAIFGTLILSGIFIIILRLVKEFFDGLIKGKRKWQKYIRGALGVKLRKKLPELFWIRFVVLAGLWIGLAVLILRIWGLSETGFQKINLIIMDGFAIGSLKIIPIRIVLAIIAVIVILAISRWFRSRLELSWLLRTNMERGAREAVATISGYIGVAIAVLVSLSIAGVEFGNLAIIAGALSVGIGFGLQNIVNNFVSGLILLFERPVKTGDWIVVGNTEGYVRRISIRSTQIQTFDQADVIVPNSELISGQVTNWMLRDVRGRITVPIGVAYGSDTLLVKKLLLDVAYKHSSVVNDGSSPEPKVLFISFGDSALLFELRVFIKNIDQRFLVSSDLNFAIDEVFREHNIQIP
ncbi:MAG: mechanosensitive ion channel, partial [Gammaproteobacteria bacterium]|nr:mechanosensitive ion channel [Gammaproteobacteria bacterium]